MLSNLDPIWVELGTWERVTAPDFFVCVVYVAPVGSKHKSESLLQNLVANIFEV
jgi:hypothetical protein